MRWGVEGGQRPAKPKLQLESFSCKAELPIRRDFFAVAYMDSLASADCRGRRRSRRRAGSANSTSIRGEPTKRSPYRSFRAIHPPSQDCRFQAGRGSGEDDPAKVEGNGRMGSQTAGRRAKKSTTEAKVFDKL
ncbi:MAG: hypothetical protein LBU32_17380 [Clostridiales bacterium]|nr:hypothetical protein [Clostridiales bacterium]